MTALRRLAAGLSSVLVGSLAVVVLLLVAAGPASAHDVLTGTDPADGAELPQGPPRVTLTFDHTPSGFAVVTVVGPGGTRWDTGPTTVTDSRVSVGVAPLGPAGTYEVGYRIVSSDGHPVSGETRFVLTRAGGGTPTGGAGDAAATASGDPAASAATSEGGVPVWPFVVAAVVIVAGAVALALRRRPG